MVAVSRTWEEERRAKTVLANWERYPRPSEIDEETGRDIDRIHQAILDGDVRVLQEYGGLQAAMKHSVALEKQAHRRAGRGLKHRTATWRRRIWRSNKVLALIRSLDLFSRPRSPLPPSTTLSKMVHLFSRLVRKLEKEPVRHVRTPPQAHG